MSTDHDQLDDFFSRYPDFEHDPSKEIWAEFNRMCDEFGWDSEDYEMREARREFKAAIVQLFNALYGTNADDLAAWQKLHKILSLDPAPEDLSLCRKVSTVALCVCWSRANRASE